MAVLWAAALPPADPTTPAEKWFTLFWLTLAVASLLLCGSCLILLFNRLRKRKLRGRPTTGDQLARFREMHERGELTSEEFQRIRSSLGKRIRRELNMPAPPPTIEPPGPRPNGKEPSDNGSDK